MIEDLNFTFFKFCKTYLLELHFEMINFYNNKIFPNFKLNSPLFLTIQIFSKIHILHTKKNGFCNLIFVMFNRRTDI